ncbi:MAG: glutamine synthetase family protein [Microthrixaceae bacterium]
MTSPEGTGRPGQGTARQDYVLRSVEERGIRLIRLWFCDVLGQMKSVAISPVELEKVLDEGLQFDGSAIDGFSRVHESDVLARPDPASFGIVRSGRDGGPATAAMFCDIESLDGEPFAGDPRAVLRRVMADARAAGYEFMCAPEVEFFYFADGDPGTPLEPLDEASYFDLTITDVASDLRRRTIGRLEALAIPVEYSFHEDGNSQHEIDLQWDDALAMADNVMALRMVVREEAHTEGVHATFMPKPLANQQGSGMHTHLSLFRNDTNAFHDPDDPYGLSEVGRSFVAGLLAHAREITAVTNQLVNSYKRLVPGFEAPSTVSWARNNRSALVRVPRHKTDKDAATRVEFRSPDPACNPYLAFALILAAGMRGIEGGYELPAEAPDDLHRLDDAARADLGIDLLPQSLAEALDTMADSELVRTTLGPHIFEWFVRNKRSEWADYKAHVSQFELDAYLRAW